MLGALTVLTVLLTIGLIAEALALLVLTRQIGILHERLAPIGPQQALAGLQPGQALPRLTARRLDGSTLILGGAGARPVLLMVVGADCPVCKRVLPLAREAARTGGIDFVPLGEGDVAAWTGRAPSFGLAGTLTFSHELLLLLQVDRLPTVLVVDASGTILARDVVGTAGDLTRLMQGLPPVSSSSEPAAVSSKESLHVAL